MLQSFKFTLYLNILSIGALQSVGIWYIEARAYFEEIIKYSNFVAHCFSPPEQSPKCEQPQMLATASRLWPMIQAMLGTTNNITVVLRTGCADAVCGSDNPVQKDQRCAIGIQMLK